MLQETWSANWTASEAYAEAGLEFKGPGIYEGDQGSILVLSIGRAEGCEWNGSFTITERFNFLIFEGRSVSKLINMLGSAPSRESVSPFKS